VEHHFYRSRSRPNWWEAIPADLATLHSPGDTGPIDMAALVTEKQETLPVDTPTTSTRLSAADSVATNTLALNTAAVGSNHEAGLGVDIGS